jgi:organic hydroperoxide reductase OsmC/OhrA
MIETHDYQVEIRSTGLKTGVLDAAADGIPSLETASPPEFGGPGETWSPEHLFVASLSACLMTTFRAIAANSKLEVFDYSDEASGHLSRGEDRYYRIESVTLRPRVVIADESKVDRALRLLDKAEKACLISRSVNAEIRLEPTVEVLQQVSA